MTDKFCYLPFRELYYEDVDGGRFSSCCTQTTRFKSTALLDNDPKWFENSEELSKIRQDFLSGNPPESCSRCRILEDKGIQSYRKQWNTKYDHDPIENIEPKLELLDIRLSNKCNLQCKMCNSEFSDQIAKKHLDMYTAGLISNYPVEHIARPLSVDILDNMFNFIMDSPYLKEIKLAGGEPMIMPEVEKFLERLVVAGRTNLRVFMLTNATVVRSKMIAILEKFEYVELSCSIDGVGKYIEYQRAPASWNSIKKNYEKLIKTNIHVTLTPCWSQLNLLGVVDYFKWLETVNVKWLAFNEVNYPSYLNWELIPMKYREELISKLDSVKLLNTYNSDYANFFKRITTDERKITIEERKKLKKAVVLWDYKSKIKYAGICPWAAELLDENNET